MIFERFDSLWDRIQVEHHGKRKVGIVTNVAWPQDSRLAIFLSRFKEHCERLLVTAKDDWELTMLLHELKPVDHVFYHELPDASMVISTVNPRVIGVCDIVQPTEKEIEALDPVGCKVVEVSLQGLPNKPNKRR